MVKNHINDQCRVVTCYKVTSNIILHYFRHYYELEQAVQSMSTNSTNTNMEGNISVTEHNDKDFFTFYDTPETSSSDSA